MNKQTNVPVQGVVFRLYQSDGKTKIADYTTDANGKIFVKTTLPEGDYFLQEIETPANIELDTTMLPIKLAWGKVTQVYIGNNEYPNLNILKKSNQTGESVADVTFNLYLEDKETFVGEYTTDENGKILIENTLLEGEYFIKEIKTPDNIVLDDTMHPVSLKWGETTIVEIGNNEYPNLDILKRNIQTGEPVEGVTFNLYLDDKETIVGEYTTDENGKVFIENTLLAGDYFLQEIETPDHIVLDDTMQPITLSWGQTTVVNIKNNEYPKVDILKTNIQTGEPVEGVTFNLYLDDKETIVGEYTTDENGKVFIENTLLAGDYFLQEIETPDHIVLDDTMQPITLSWGQTTVVNIKNNEYPNLDILKKSNQTDESVADVTFRLFEADGKTVIDDYTTDKKGKILIENTLLEGEYFIKEIKTPDNIVLDDTMHPVSLKWGETTIVEIGNDEYPNLDILKLDEQDTNIVLEGFTFRLFEKDGITVIDDYITDKNGKILIENTLLADDYFLQEISVPKPIKFVLDDTIHPIKLEWGETTKIKLENTRTSTVQLKKIDIEDKRPLEGVTYRLETIDGLFIGDFTTNKEGIILVDELIPKDYILTEIETTDWHILDETPIKVTLIAGETTFVERENKRQKGNIEIYKSSSSHNAITNDKANDKLQNIEYEVLDINDNVVATLKTDKNGYAKTDKLDIGVYKVKEILADYYHLANLVAVDLKHDKDIYTHHAANDPINLKTDISKHGLKEAKKNDLIPYVFTDIKNSSDVTLSEFFWWDDLPAEAIRLEYINTGVWNEKVILSFYITTNKTPEYVMIKDGLKSSEENLIDCTPEKLNLAKDEFITGYKVGFGDVKVGFETIKEPYIYARVIENIPNDYVFTNKTGVAGCYLDVWVKAEDNFSTKIKSDPIRQGKLPKTGFYD